MTGIFKERREEREEVSTLPRIERVERGVYHPIETLSRSASNIRIHPEDTYSSVIEASRSAAISRNVSALLISGSTSLPSRFARMLEAL
ncbi:hypothetical protein GF318_00675 [Candidatus Micrarchaeota archaeon]|nr:hypothetical protein [Candidatus Micrarchaeota archaeon]